MLTLGEINVLKGFENAPTARENNLKALRNHLRLMEGQRKLCTAWDVRGKFDNHKPFLQCGRTNALSSSSAVASLAERLTSAMPESPSMWSYQQRLVDLALESGGAPTVTKIILRALRRADKEGPAGARRRKAVDAGAVWDSLSPLTETLEEMWCYADWRGVAAALEDEFAVSPPGGVSSFALVDALYGIANWAQERNETEQLTKAAELLSLCYSRPGYPRQAVLLLSLPLARSSARALRALLDECARAAAEDENGLVRALGYVLNWRLSGAAEWNMPPDDWGSAELRRLAAGQGAGRDEIQQMLGRLEGASLEQQFGSIISLANLSNFYATSLNSFKLYWEMVVRRLLVLMQSPAVVIAWAVVVALRMMTRNLLSIRGELPDLMVFYLVDVIRSHPLLPASMACKSLEDTLNDPLGCELVARLGLQSSSSPAGLRFATAAMLTKVGCRPGRLAELRRLFQCVLEDSDPIGQDGARWALRRLKKAEGDSANHYKQKGDGPEGMVGVVGGGIAEVAFLNGVEGGEVLEFPDGVSGVAVGLGGDKIGAVIRGGDGAVRNGDPVKLTPRFVEIKVGDRLIGRVVSPLGRELDGKGPIVADTKKRVGFIGAKPALLPPSVGEPFPTGVKTVDEVAPFRRGECLLVVGCGGLGKTSLVLDAILNQKGKGVICVYVAVGHDDADAERAVKVLKDGGAMDYTVVVKSTASDPPDLRLLAPYAGATVGRYFSEAGRHALTVYDDLWGYAAYPGAAALASSLPEQLERVGGALYTHTLMIEHLLGLSRVGDGSLTSMVVLDTSTSELPLQIIAASHGQVAFDKRLFRHGVRHAVDVGRSTSRAAAATPSGGGRQVFAPFACQPSVGLRQPRPDEARIKTQVLAAWTAARGYFENVREEQTPRLTSDLLRLAENSHPDLLRRLESAGRAIDDVEAELERIIKLFEENISVSVNVNAGAARAGEHHLPTR
jgi:F-type H+/Na+-transporting ATPase subunit alpha